MSAGNYFVSEEARQAKRWEMLEQHKDAKSKVCELGNELTKFAKSWAELAAACDGWKENTFIVTEDGVDVRRPARAGSERDGWVSNRAAKVPSTHFDFNLISTLLQDLQRAKKEAAELDSQMKDIGA